MTVTAGVQMPQHIGQMVTLGSQFHCGPQGSNSGHQVYKANAFTCCAILPSPSFTFLIWKTIGELNL